MAASEYEFCFRLAVWTNRPPAPAELIPPIKSVETISGGTLRAIVVRTLAPEARARLTAVMGSTPWKVIETGDPHVAGVDFRPIPEQDPS